MIRSGIRRLSVSLLLLTAAVGLAARAAAEQRWTTPTQEELTMTSQAGAPGAPAVYLYKEETTIDYLHVYTEYVRMKILSEGGRERANVELRYFGGGELDLKVSEIEGRTIHPDGTIVAFTGKPYEREIMKGIGVERYKYKAKVFTLPDVTVGSIIEYRYAERWADTWYRSPNWIVQDDLYLRSGHFVWKPTSRDVGDGNGGIAWTPILPAGVTVTQKDLPQQSFVGSDDRRTIEVTVKDIPPIAKEEHMPPVDSLSYRVLFYYTSAHSAQEYWKRAGKDWSRDRERFMGHGTIGSVMSPGTAVADAVRKLVGPSDTPDEKLRKLYAAVMRLDNTDFTREHSRAEDKAAGLSQLKTIDDVWTHERGSSDQIADLFVEMARDAGLKAYVMTVTNRDRHIFYQQYLSLQQLDDDIAVVTVDGKDKFFDPGSRYCAFGHLAWKHTLSQGLRQTDDGTAIAMTPPEIYTASGMNRVANLTLDSQGLATGKIGLTFLGASALKWRQLYLTSDQTGVEHELEESLREQLPGGMEVKVASIDKLTDYDVPLTVNYTVSGAIGSPTGKRLLIVGDLFETNTKATFAHEKRELPIALDYAYSVHDAIRINFPAGFSVESAPVASVIPYAQIAFYNIKSESAPTSVTIRRAFGINSVLFPQKEYPALRAFYTQFETKDQEPVVLKVGAAGVGGQ